MTRARVLLVEDHEGIRETVADFLREQGHLVVTRESGDAGLESLTQMRFDIVLVDQFLPGLNGPELVQLARERNLVHPGETDFIGMTAEMDPRGFRELGVEVFLKPFSLDALDERVNRSVAQHRTTLPTRSLDELAREARESLEHEQRELLTVQAVQKRRRELLLQELRALEVEGARIRSGASGAEATAEFGRKFATHLEAEAAQRRVEQRVDDDLRRVESELAAIRSRSGSNSAH